MKSANTKLALIAPRLMRAIEAYDFLGTRQVLVDCERAKWITPVVRRTKLTLYSVADLHTCADRIERGEYPVP